MTTYAELTTQILNYTEVSTDVLSSTITDDIIKRTENRIARDVDLDVFRSYQNSTLTADSPFLTLPGGASPTMESIIGVRSFQIASSSTASRTNLEMKDISYMNEYWPDRDETGTPRYWSWWDFNTLYVAPTPSSALYVELALTKMPTRLSTSNANTWIGDNIPEPLLYGCLAEAFKFLKGPAEMLQIYEQSYVTTMQQVSAEWQGRHRRDEYKDGVLRVPLQSTNP